MAITTGKVRLSYCHVWQPQAPQGGGEPKYSVTLLIPKSDVTTINALYAEMEQAKQAGVNNTWGGTLPPIVKIPLYDGDGVRQSGEPFGPECKGCMVIVASSKTQPQVVDLNVQPILNQAEVYSGCYGRVSLNFFAYNQAGNRGIGCGLNCVQKIADGDPLSGGVSAQEAFGGSNAYAGVAQTQQGMMGSGIPTMQGAGTAAYSYQAPAPGNFGGYAQPRPGYQQPQPMQQQIDPITGMPTIQGGVMGIS